MGGVTVVALSAVQGGYFPAAWAWSSLALLWAAATALVLTPRIEVSRSAMILAAATAAVAAWAAASIAWSLQPARSVEEVQRALVYVGVVLVAILVVRRTASIALLAGTLAGMAIVSGYGLATRLLPAHLGTYDPIAGYRLAEPFGYWNALGIFAAMGGVLALGFAIEAPSLLGRAASAASIAVFAPTLYFTYSRGAVIAGALGVVLVLVMTPRRLGTIAKGLPVVALPVAAALYASRQDALTRQQEALTDAAAAGERVAVVVAVCAAGAAGAAVLAALAERRFRATRTVRLAFGSAVAVLAAAAALAAFGAYGAPWTLTARAYSAFHEPPPQIQGDLNRRLLSFSGNGRAELWRVAWDQWQRHPVAGTGAGTYERVWLQERDRPLKVRDAHGLYLEMLAELGPVAVVLLSTIAGCVALAAFGGRRHLMVPAAFGAFGAYLAHAGIDWDWEIPGLTATALLIGTAMVVRDERFGRVEVARAGRAVLLAGVLAVSVLAFVGVLGAAALSSSQTARREGDLPKAAVQAQRASRWLPWSPRPHILLGEIELQAGLEGAARESFLSAIRRDGDSWSAWLGLARATSGDERARALAHASALNPKSREIAAFREAPGR